MVLQAEKRGKYTALLVVLLVVSIVAIPLVFFLSTPPPTDSIIQLPDPDVIGNMLLSDAMRNPGYSPVLADYQMRISEISQLLWAVQGITHGSVFRAIPSAGGTYPLEIFLIQTIDSDLEEGYYHYVPQEHSLEGINITISSTSLISAFSGDDQIAVSNVSTVFFILANYSKTTERYGDRGVQYVHLETGHAIQNFLIQLTSLGLRTRPIVQFETGLIQDLLRTSWDPLVALPVGHAEEDLQGVAHYNIADGSDATVEQAIANRRSTREYINGSIPNTVLTDVLNDSNSITYLEGNCSLIDLRVLAGQVDGLATGSYRYELTDSSLTQFSSIDLRDELMVAGLNQPWIGSAQIDLVISVNTGWIYGEPDFVWAHRIA
ncbi:MAG: SagB family peptide dehydrogenase, partial [Candidatus Hodarchaeota archaeon]